MRASDLRHGTVAFQWREALVRFGHTKHCLLVLYRALCAPFGEDTRVMDLFVAPVGAIPPLAPPPATDDASLPVGSTAPPDLTTLRNQLDVQEQRILNNWYTQHRRCIFCQKTYLEIDNLGQWLCGQQMSGAVNTSGFGAPQIVTQLVRADHRWMFNPMRWTAADDQVLSQSLANYLQAARHLNAQSIVKTTKGKNCVGVARFDQRATESLLEACSEYTHITRSYVRQFPFSVDCGPMELRAVRPFLALHDQLYNAATQDTVVRRTPVVSLRRTIASVPDSDRLVMRRLQLRRAQEARERARQAARAARVPVPLV